jgi:hypothetical protein
MTARDLIAGSMRLIGVLATGETPSAAEQADALSALNDMLQSWSTENLFIPNVVRESFSLVAGQQAYTMGTGGNFSTTRPVDIDQAFIQDPGSNPISELPVRILTESEWAAIQVKGTQSTYPTQLYPEGTYPLETLNLWPVPSQTCTLVLYTKKLLTGTLVAGDTLSLPPGYSRALRYALALEIAPEYGRTPSDLIVATAAKAVENIKSKNIKPHYLAVDEALVSKHSGFNWITGE